MPENKGLNGPSCPLTERLCGNLKNSHPEPQTR
jgi:hypothetical protein